MDSSASTSAEPDSRLSDGNNGESESASRKAEVTETRTTSDMGSWANSDWNTQELEVQVTEAEDLEVLLGEEINVHINNESSSDINDNGSHEVFNEHYVMRSDVSHARDIVDHSTNSEHNTNEEFDSHESSAQVDFQESVMEIEENVDEQDQIQESHDWPSHDLQEAIDNWLDMPSEEVGTSVERLNTLYFPDDDNVQSMELRELLSRYGFQ